MKLLKRKWPPMAASLVAVFLLVGCVSSGVDTYREFEGAVEAEASCRQLIAIRDNFGGSDADRDRIDRDLGELGCATRDSQRNDQ